MVTKHAKRTNADTCSWRLPSTTATLQRRRDRYGHHNRYYYLPSLPYGVPHLYRMVYDNITTSHNALLTSSQCSCHSLEHIFLTTTPHHNWQTTYTTSSHHRVSQLHLPPTVISVYLAPITMIPHPHSWTRSWTKPAYYLPVVKHGCHTSTLPRYIRLSTLKLSPINCDQMDTRNIMPDPSHV